MIAATAPKLSKTGRAALWYAVEKGWRVFPLHSADGPRCSCGAAQCGGVGKHPRTARGCLDASTDPATIRAWWTEHPDANVGIATGHGLAVIDVDPRHGGDDALVDLRRTLGDLPDTVECLTGGGGRHLYLSLPDGCDVRNSASVLGPGIDVRGAGGYVVATPSTHESGRSYGWEASSRPEQVEVAAVPGAWLAAILKRPKLRVLPGGAGEVIAEGERNTTLFKRAASMRSAGFEQSEIEAAVQVIAAERCVPPVDPAEVKAIVASVCRYPAGLSPEYQAAKDAAAKPAEPSGDWEQDLYRTAKGAVKNTYANVCAILRHAPEYATLAYNEMAIAPTLHGRAIPEAETGAIREHFERTWGISPALDTLSSAVLTVSSERAYHPVKSYLRGVAWDGVERINDLTTEVLRAEPLPINAVMLRAWFISAVARALNPGVKVDTALVLVGAQGVQKSGFFRALGGEWFSDTSINLDSKDAYQQIRAAWLYEWAEIEHVTSRSHASRVKAFVTSQADTFRPPFARNVATFERSNVIVGSTNEDQFLTDPSGDRRFWVVRVTGRIDVAVVAHYRDQLWAEAVAAYTAGESHWLGAGHEAERDVAAEVFRVTDPWEDTVRAWLATRAKISGDEEPEPVTTKGVLFSALGVPVERQDHRASMRVAAIFKRLGWRNHVARVGVACSRVWYPGDVTG